MRYWKIKNWWSGYRKIRNHAVYVKKIIDRNLKRKKVDNIIWENSDYIYIYGFKVLPQIYYIYIMIIFYNGYN